MRDVFLETDRLILREIKSADFQGFHRLLSDKDLMKYQFISSKDEAETLEYINKKLSDQSSDPRTFYELAIVDKGSGSFVGFSGLYIKSKEFGVASLGCVIDREFQNRGYATEASRAVIKHGFSELGLFRIEGTCFFQNEASAKFLQKTGMSYEGLLRGAVFVGGQRWDIKIFALIKPECNFL